MVANISSVIAVLAALAAVYYARQTVGVARRSFDEQVKLLEATTKAHEREMTERRRALQQELWLQRLTQLVTLQDLLGEAAEMAYREIERCKAEGKKADVRPDDTGQLPSAILRVEVGATILGRLGGPSSTQVTKLVAEGKKGGTSLHHIAGTARRALVAVRDLVASDESFKPPTDHADRP